MTFDAQADANRRAESTTSRKLASFRQMPLQAGPQPPEERDETHETPAKKTWACYPGSPGAG